MNTSLRRKLFTQFLRLFDLAMLTAAYAAALAVAYGAPPFGTWAVVLTGRVNIGDVLIYVACLTAWNVICSSCGLSHSRRLARFRQDLKDLFLAIVLATLATGAIAALFRSPVASAAALSVYAAVACLTLGGGRMGLRLLLGGVRRKGRNLRHLIIVGTNRRALEFVRSIELRRDVGYCVQGFVDNDWFGCSVVTDAGYSIVSNLADFPDYLRGTIVDEVVICLPMQSMFSEIRKIANACVEQGIVTRVFADFLQQTMAVTRTDEFEGRPVLTMSSPGIAGVGSVCKSFFDRVGALVLLTAISPLLVLTAILIKSTSKGPVLFRQPRLGINKRVFQVFKFRTMVVGAELKLAEMERANEVSGPVFKMQNDPRVTPLGRILRKRSIDELPQLINVLLGDMSLVGPRPLPVRDYEGFSTHWHLRRFSVRPGISCLWQIQGRSSIPFERWMELDMQYIDDWSFWLDMKILMKTIPAVFGGQGAS